MLNLEELISLLRSTDIENSNSDCRVNKTVLEIEECPETCRQCRFEAHNRIADIIENALNSLPLNQSKSTGFPEGIEWPHFEDGELVKFHSPIKAVWDKGGDFPLVPTSVEFVSNERTVIHASGFTGDIDTITLKKGEFIKRPESDTLEAVDADAAKDPCEYFNGRTPDKCADCKLHADDAGFDFDVQFAECRTAMARDLLARQRKLMGGE